MAYPNIPHRVEQTRNKYSRAILKENTIIIRLARNLSFVERREHRENLLRRMMQQVLTERRKKVIDPFRQLLDGQHKTTLILATKRRYTFSLSPGVKTHAKRTRKGWHVTIGPNIRRRSLHRFLWKILAEAEHARMEKMVDIVNSKTLRVRVDDVRIAFAASQWGSCSPKGRIMLNAALLFMPISVLRYVITHELAHRNIPNHSERYWQEVASALPRYRHAMRILQNYRLPSL